MEEEDAKIYVSERKCWGESQSGVKIHGDMVDDVGRRQGNGRCEGGGGGRGRGGGLVPDLGTSDLGGCIQSNASNNSNRDHWKPQASTPCENMHVPSENVGGCVDESRVVGSGEVVERSHEVGVASPVSVGSG